MSESHSTDTNRTGVYAIVNRVNGKVYIGSAAVNFHTRWRKHRDALRRGEHHSQHFQRAWIKYGEEAFSFEILVFCEPADCVRLEQIEIDAHDATNQKYGYNNAPTAGSPLGMKASPETREKMSAWQRGRKMTPEACANMSAAKRGIKPTAECRAKMSAAQLGRKHSAETKAKIATSHLGKKVSDTTRAAISAGKRGKPGRKLSQEEVAAIKVRMRGRYVSPETRAKIAAARRGKRVYRTKNTYAPLFPE